jgi:hypothetical protein
MTTYAFGYGVVLLRCIMSAVVGGGRVRFADPALGKELEGWGTHRFGAGIERTSDS